MNYERADKAATAALQSIADRTPASEGFAKVREIVLPALPAQASEVARGLDIAADLDALCEQLVHVLADDPPAPEINGLCFGLVEMIFGKEDGSPPDSNQHPEHTLYICGSARFDPEDTDWPCDPEWWPETRYFSIPSFKALSDLAAALDPDASWLVACGLIEPLSILLVGEACRRIDRATLLGGASWRGIGSGYDGGDLRDIGVITQDGFASPALIESTPAPAAVDTPAPRPKASKPKAMKPKATKAKPAKSKASRSKRAKAKTSKAKGSSTSRAARKKKAAGKKKASTKAGRKPSAKAPGKKRAGKSVAKKGPARKKAARTTSKKKSARRR